MVPPTEKKSLGRRKIEIKKLVHESQKQVTFSKRRAGIFKKAAELAVLCDTQIAVVTFSPGEKCFCFGHSSADAVIDRFASGGLHSGTAAGLPEDFLELNREYAEASAVLDGEKRKSAGRNSGDGGFWCEKAAEGMCPEEMEVFLTALRELKFNVEKKIEAMGSGSFPGSGAPEESGFRRRSEVGAMGFFGGHGGEWDESDGGGGGMFSNGFDASWVNGQP